MKILPCSLVAFYRFWHGTLHLKGAGYLIKKLLPYVRGLREYSLRLSEGHTITVDFRDVSALYWLNYRLGDRFEEEGLLTAIVNQLTPESVVWDVGANCGMLSYRLARLGRVRKLVYFEPNPAMFKLARQALEPFGDVTGFNCALSNSSGDAILTIPDSVSAMATLEHDRTKRSGRSLRIERRTGDGMITAGQAPVPDLIKIDTEGHEAAVIQGLVETIEKHRPKVFFEHISLRDEELHRLIPPGYAIYSVSDSDGSLSAGFDRKKGHNSALLPLR